MAQYRMTGNSSFKTAADSAKNWMLYYIQVQEANVGRNSEYITKFVKDYSTTNKDLQTMQKSIKKVKSEGPALEDQYLTNKEAAEDTPRDFAPYYIKGGVILGTLVLVSVLFMRD